MRGMMKIDKTPCTCKCNCRRTITLTLSEKEAHDLKVIAVALGRDSAVLARADEEMERLPNGVRTHDVYTLIRRLSREL